MGKAQGNRPVTTTGGAVERPDAYCQTVRDIIVRVGANCGYCSAIYDLIDVDTGGPASRAKRRGISVAEIASVLGRDPEVVDRHVSNHLERWGLVVVTRPGGQASPRVRVAYNPQRGINDQGVALPAAPSRKKKKPAQGRTAKEIGALTAQLGRELTSEQRKESRHSERGDRGRFAPGSQETEWAKRPGVVASNDTTTASKEQQR